MTDKTNYQKNIPEHGVLVKDDNNVIQLVAIVKNGLARTPESPLHGSDMIIDFEDDLYPIDAQDWWKFAPWQPIDTAPIDTSIYLHDMGNRHVIGSLCEDGRLLSSCGKYIHNPNVFKWLPLPTPTSKHEE